MKRLLTALIAVVALALVPASAMAKDRNHDKLPDKWEKRHHLSLHHNQARRDQDKDGLRNLAEFRQQTDPRDDDSDEDGIEDGDEHKFGHDASDEDGDNDGVDDGDENAGTVKSFAGGVLTITLAKGGEVSGAVTDATDIECGNDDDQGDDHGDDDSGDDHQGDDRIARASHDGDGNDESDSGSGTACTSAALKTGAIVKEAELELKDGTSSFHDVELLG
jgi:hypothetical protein